MGPPIGHLYTYFSSRNRDSEKETSLQVVPESKALILKVDSSQELAQRQSYILWIQ